MEMKKDTRGKSKTVQSGVSVLLLMSFLDVLPDSFKNKQFAYSTEPLMQVPDNSLLIWKKRGYEPSATGVAKVQFEGRSKEYIYPAYFWCE